jgi:PD-(D/E)XK nuclease superfamily
VLTVAGQGITGAEGVDSSSKSAEVERLRRLGRWLPGPVAALEVLGQAGLERAHQAYLAWLLDPQGSHGLDARVLSGVLRHSGRAADAGQLLLARVKKEDVQAESRADIVVTMPSHTLVIELKVQSGEGDEQTRRLADDYQNWPDPLLVFLTLDGSQPRDPRFQIMSFSELAGCLDAALKDAAEPGTTTEISGRATASDYLFVLKRMCGMDPINQHAAWFWLRNGHDMKFARNEAIRLLLLLPGHVETALRDLAGQLGSDLQVSRRNYTAVTEEGRKYQEEAVLVYRAQWCDSHGIPQFGVGMGQRAEDKYFDPFEINKRPFCGAWAEDPQARTILGEGKANRGWYNWAWWESIELVPSDMDEDFLAYYAELVKREVRRIWLDYNGEIDGIANQTPS